MTQRLFSLFVLFLYLGCTPAPNDREGRVGFLYTGPEEGGAPGGTAFGEVSTDPAAASQSGYVRLDGTVALPADWLTARPFTYTQDGVAYWASFEPSFTGFPEYTAPGSKDFVNRMQNWQGTAPGLEFSEYRIDSTAGQPVLLLSERERGRYVQTVAVVVDSVGPDAFRGRLYRPGQTTPTSLTFRRTPAPTATTDPEQLIDRINAGYSRSSLVLLPSRGPAPDSVKQLPRRALIDEGDIGAISASFLDDGTFMLLSDDHVILQGGYVLDLDKGLLTVTEADGPVYRLFLDTDPVTFTVPVSVLRLEGTQLRGSDNYLRIELVEPAAR